MKKILTSVALAAMLAVTVGGTNPALADTIIHSWDNLGNHVYKYYGSDGKLKQEIVYDENHKYLMTIIGKNKMSFPGNPQPDGTDSGLVDYKAMIEQAMKDGGGEFTMPVDPLKTPLGKHLMGKTIVPHHNPADFNPGSFQPADGGVGGGSGGFDPMGGDVVEQMKKNGKKNKGNGDKGSGDASTNMQDTGEEFPGLWELVNPVPIPKAVAQPAKPAAKHSPKTVDGAKMDALIGALPGPTQASLHNRLTHSGAILGNQPAGAMQLPTAVGGLAGRTHAPSAAGAAAKLR